MSRKGKKNCPHTKEMQRRINGELYCREKDGRKITFIDTKCQANDCSYR
jgi:hypothetical protein